MVESHILPETRLTLAAGDWEQCFGGRLGFDGRMLPPPDKPVNVPSRSSNTASCSHLKAALLGAPTKRICSNRVVKPPCLASQNEHARRAAQEGESKFTTWFQKQ